MQVFSTVCRERGLRVTHQRAEVFRELAGTGEHPDAETLLARVRARVPQMSQDTVYRTLATLEESGLIRRVDSAGGRARFDANFDAHHHLLCTECGRITDIYSDTFNALAPPRGARRWGQVKRVQVQFHGICADCQTKHDRRQQGNAKEETR